MLVVEALASNVGDYSSNNGEGYWSLKDWYFGDVTPPLESVQVLVGLVLINCNLLR